MLKARKPCGGPEFAIGLIAAKPVKPCDGGIFGALDSLLKTEHKKRNSKQHRRDRLAAVAWLRLSGCTDWHWRCGAIAEKLIAVRRVERRFFRSWFNSAKSRQTVRWGRFWGLGFAPEKGAIGTESKAPQPPLSGCCRLFAAICPRSLASVWRCGCSKSANRYDRPQCAPQNAAAVSVGFRTLPLGCWRNTQHKRARAIESRIPKAAQQA